jgi:UDP-N-acetyl-D-mannosaminuronate dehydrogenase
MPAVIASKIRNSVEAMKHPRIVAIGMAYKPNTADTRHSPGVEVVRLLREYNYDVTDHDPMVSGKGYDSLVEAVSGADCLAVLVEHDVVIKELESNLNLIKASMRSPLILRF